MSQPQGPRLPAPRLHPPHAAKTMQSRMMFSDRLVGFGGMQQCELTTHWARVAQTIARKMRKGAGLDTAAHMGKDSGSSTALKTRGDLPRAQTPANIEPPRMCIATSAVNTLEPT